MRADFGISPLEEELEFSDPLKEAAAATARGQEKPTHRDRITVGEEYFRTRKPALCSAAVEELPSVQRLWEERSAAQVKAVQREIDAWTPVHYACKGSPQGEGA